MKVSQSLVSLEIRNYNYLLQHRHNYNRILKKRCEFQAKVPLEFEKDSMVVFILIIPR